MATQDIVQKLWNLCDVLRDDGINYSDYVTELVLLLFIKMEHESTESGVLHKHKLPDYARWGEFTRRSGMDLLLYYKEALLKLSQSTDPLIAANGWQRRQHAVFAGEGEYIGGVDRRGQHLDPRLAGSRFR